MDNKIAKKINLVFIKDKACKIIQKKFQKLINSKKK